MKQKLNVKSIVILISILFSSGAEIFAQSYKVAEPLYMLMRETKSAGSLNYIDSLKGFGGKELSAFFKNAIATKGKKNLAFTEAEKKQLLASLDSSKWISWDDSLFEEGQRIGYGGIWLFLKNSNMFYLKEMRQMMAQKDTVAARKYKEQNRPYVFSFTKPVMLRNNTLCLVNMTALCGQNCGYREMSFYEKTKGKWKKVALVVQGDF